MRSAAGSGAGAGRPLRNRRFVWAAALFLVGLSLAAQFAKLAEPDIAYNLYAPARLLDGARLYRDLVDMNPPLIFAINLPIVWLARAAHVSDVLLFRIAATAMLGGLLLFTRRLLARYPLQGRPVERRYLLLGLCFILFPLSGEDFGQREHLVLGLLLPYTVLAVGRLRGEGIDAVDAAWAGVLAGLGLALKPQFVLAVVGVEAGRRLLADRGNGRRVTWEGMALMATLAVYALAILVFTPGYLKVVVDLGPGYSTYLQQPLLDLFLFAPGAGLTAVALLAAISVRRCRRDRGGRAILTLAMVGCFLAGVAQQKGLRYHYYPSFALAALLLAVVAAGTAEALSPVVRLYVRLSRWLAAAVAVVVVGSTAVDAGGGTVSDRRHRAEFLDLVETVRVRSHGEPIGMLSYHMGAAFPLVNYAHVRLASRFPFLWLLPVSYWRDLGSDQPIRYHTLAEMRPPERLLNEAVTQDLISARPRLILILRPFPDEGRYGFRRLNYVAYFGRQPPLAALLAGYQFIVAKGQYDIYERLDPGTARTGAPPSAVVPPPVGVGGESAGPLPLLGTEAAMGVVVFVLVAVASIVRGRWLRSGSSRQERP